MDASFIVKKKERIVIVCSNEQQQDQMRDSFLRSFTFFQIHFEKEKENRGCSVNLNNIKISIFRF